jgi:hypothetical protein
MTTLRREEGQVTVLTAVFMVILLGITGFVLDVGSWFHQQREEQTTVDAAALAGAQSLPGDSNAARTQATTYATKNGGVDGVSVTISSKFTPNDMVTVTQAKDANGFFSKLFGVPTVTIHRRASAISEVPSEVNGAAPIVVDIHHQQLCGSSWQPNAPCYPQFNVPTTISLGKKGVPGAFGWLDLVTENGNSGSSDLADWIARGYQGYLPLGDYDSDTGAKNKVQSALESRYGSDLLFPVYDSLSGTGSNAPYHIIAWVSFHLTSSAPGPQGNVGTLNGFFDRVIWDGIVSAQGQSGPPNPDLGVYSVALID